MNEVGVKIIQTEETKEGGIKYLNINVSNSEVERNPDIVRLCADVGILEYAKSKTGHWIDANNGFFNCSECGAYRSMLPAFRENYCPNCGARMDESQESEDKE